MRAIRPERGGVLVSISIALLKENIELVLGYSSEVWSIIVVLGSMVAFR